MRMQSAGHAIGVSLIGLTFLLTAPDSGASQDLVRSGLSANKPLSYHLSALSSNSFFSRHGGIWVRHEGMWAFRPTLRFDWQAYFRCQAGYGCGGLGWAPHRFGSWLPFGFGGWDLVPGGWMWFPGQRLARSRAWDLFWDLWFFSPSHMFGTYGSGSQLRTSFAPIVWDGGRTATSGDNRPGQGREEWKAPADAGTRDLTQPLVHPVRAVPVVTVSADGEDSEPFDPKATTTPSIDRVRLDPRVEPRAKGASQRTSRQELEGKSGDLLGRERYLSQRARLGRFTTGATQSGTESKFRSRSNPSVFRRDNSVKRSPVPSAAARLKSPRSPATGTRTTGQSKSRGKTAPEQ